MQRELIQIRNELKKPEYNHTKAEIYKAHIETKRNEADKAQDTLIQVIEEYEAKIIEKIRLTSTYNLKMRVSLTNVYNHWQKTKGRKNFSQPNNMNFYMKRKS